MYKEEQPNQFQIACRKHQRLEFQVQSILCMSTKCKLFYIGIGTRWWSRSSREKSHFREKFGKTRIPVLDNTGFSRQKQFSSKKKSPCAYSLLFDMEEGNPCFVLHKVLFQFKYSSHYTTAIHPMILI